MAATYSVLVRCRLCRRWASIREGDEENARCGQCGAAVEVADMDAHRATLPVSGDDPSEVAKFQTQKSKTKP